MGSRKLKRITPKIECLECASITTHAHATRPPGTETALVRAKQHGFATEKARVEKEKEIQERFGKRKTDTPNQHQ